MKQLVIFILLFSFSLFAQTYGELVSEVVPNQYDLIKTKILQVNNRTQPKDVKILRKDIGKLKIYLDVFIYAYEKEADRDLLKTIRKDIDEAYAVFGHFKDLYDTFEADELTPEIIKERRDLVLEWKHSFLKDSKQRLYEDYLDNPLLLEIQKRKKKRLPKFFWAIVKFPEEDIDNGNKVIEKLLNGMLKKAKKRLEDVVELKDLFSYKRENQFHDFRKLLRAHLKLVDVFFKHELTDDYLVSYNRASELVSMFGNINDLLVKLHHSKESTRIKQRIKDDWKRLIKVIHKAEFFDIFKNLKL